MDRLRPGGTLTDQTDETDEMDETVRGMTRTAPPRAPAGAAFRRRSRRPVDLGWQLPVVAVVVVSILLAVSAADDERPARLVMLCCSIAAYATLRRWAVWRWLAAVAVLPGAVGAGLLDLSASSTEPAHLVLVALVSLGCVLAAWRAQRPAVTLALAAAGAAAGVVAVDVLGVDRPDRASWSAASAFLVLAVPAALGLLASVGLARAEGCTGLRTACAVVVLAPLAVLLVAHGDALSALAWWPAGGALGLTAMARGRRGADADRAQGDDVDAATLAAFAAVHGRPRLAPVVVVIAAFEEADGLATALGRLPDQVCGLPAEVVLVDDGSADGTAAVAARTLAELGRGHVLACPVNRGQGAALRLGYRFAREHGAVFLVTTDADGQYDPAELETVLGPVVDGRADFVTGSRRRGTRYTGDRFRLVGTWVFALLASTLLGRWLTDTSFGLRAMRPEVTASVTLNQPQYQSSELLVGVVSHGYAVLEVPGTIGRRAAGASKKGRNLVYGSRYGRVMLGTWWREGAPRPVTEVAPATRSRPGRSRSR